MRMRAGRQGAMKRTKDGRWAHAACATYCPGVFYDTRYISNINKVFFFLEFTQHYLQTHKNWKQRLRKGVRRSNGSDYFFPAWMSDRQEGVETGMLLLWHHEWRCPKLHC